MAATQWQLDLKARLEAAILNAVDGKGFSKGSAAGSNISVTRQDLDVLQEQLDKVNAEIAEAESETGTARRFYPTPVDC